MIRHVPPLVIAAAGITVAQFHGVSFWVTLFGSSWMGLAITLIWEAGSIWLWWIGTPEWSTCVVKYLCTAALLTGMVISGVGPMLEKADRAEAVQASAAVKTKAALLTVEKLLEATVDQERKGFLDTLQSSLCAVGVVNNKCPALNEAPAAIFERESGPLKGLALPPWMLKFVAWIHLLSIPALYFLALVCLVSVGREFRPEFRAERSAPKPPNQIPEHPRIQTPKGDTPTPRKAAPEQGLNGVQGEGLNGGMNTTPNTSERLAVSGYARRHGMINSEGKYSQGKVADKIGEHRSNLSAFANGNAGPEVSERIRGKLRG